MAVREHNNCRAFGNARRPIRPVAHPCHRVEVEARLSKPRSWWRSCRDVAVHGHKEHELNASRSVRRRKGSVQRMRSVLGVGRGYALQAATLRSCSHVTEWVKSLCQQKVREQCPRGAQGSGKKISRERNDAPRLSSPSSS